MTSLPGESLRVVEGRGSWARLLLAGALLVVPLAAFQKPACFAHEKEWRIAVKLSGTRASAPDYLDATIPMTQELEIRRR